VGAELAQFDDRARFGGTILMISENSTAPRRSDDDHSDHRAPTSE
jgi:hypothetical protein